MNSNNCRNYRYIENVWNNTKCGKRFTFIAVSQLRIANEWDLFFRENSKKQKLWGNDQSGTTKTVMIMILMIKIIIDDSDNDIYYHYYYHQLKSLRSISLSSLF